MRKKANPAAIGAFVLVGLVLVIAAIATLASGQIFSETRAFICYFDESIQGLNVGAAVKYRGVPIGQVTDIGIYRDPVAEASFLTVLLEIDLDLVRDLGGTANLQDDALLEARIAEGLRARLETESIVTGIRFVYLDVWTDRGPPVLVNPDGPYPEIPTIPSAMAALGQSATDILARLSSVDVPAISVGLTSLLDQLNDRTGELDLAEVNHAMVDMLNAFERLAESEDIDLALANLRGTLEGVRTLTQNMNEHLGPTLARLDTASVEMAATMQAARETMEILRTSAQHSEAMLRPESSFRYSMEQSMTEMAAAAEALRRLTEMLERNPRALVAGKATNQ